MSDMDRPVGGNASPDVESVDFTGDALQFLKQEADSQNKSIEDVVSSAVGTYRYLRDQVGKGAGQVMIEKGGTRTKIDLS